MITAFDLGKVLYEARKREAWGKQFGQVMIDRNPWPAHEGAPWAADHDLALAEANALLARYKVEPRP